VNGAEQGNLRATATATAAGIVRAKSAICS